MVASEKSAPAKKKPRSERQSKKKSVVRPAKRIIEARKSLQPKSPHKSFRKTSRRDYARSLAIPGYIAFTVKVWRTLLQHKSIFIGLVLTYSLATAVLVGFVSQSTYTQFAELLRESGSEVMGGNLNQVEEIGLLLLAGLSGILSPQLDQAQQLMSGLLIILIWLTTVWLLRAILAGQTPRLRDGLYNSGAPIVPTILLTAILILQLIPAALAIIGISAALPTGLVSGGVEAMVFWIFVLLLFLLSLYWMVSTVMALVVVTLPGMYPLRALKAAHELVVGRRLRLVLRVVWLAFVTLLVWIGILLPTIVIDSWIKELIPFIEWLPLVPVVLLILSSASVVWVAAYVYLLYRKVVDDDTAAA